MSVPKYISDGDFNVARQNGPAEWNFPFSDKGDDKSFEAIITWRQAETAFRPQKGMTKIATRLGTAYLVDAGQASNVGNGLVEWRSTYASVPIERTEGTSIVYTLQFIIPASSPVEIGELSINTNAEVVWEYSLNQFVAQTAPKVQKVGDFFYQIGSWGTLVNGSRVLAQDSEVNIYKGKIYYRKSLYIRFGQPTLVS